MASAISLVKPVMSGRDYVIIVIMGWRNHTKSYEIIRNHTKSNDFTSKVSKGGGRHLLCVKGCLSAYHLEKHVNSQSQVLSPSLFYDLRLHDYFDGDPCVGCQHLTKGSNLLHRQ